MAGFSIVNIERKFVDLKDLKMLDAGTGSIEGYRSVFGEIDEGGDIVIKGAFADCMNEYLASGFSAHSHDWKFTEAVGYPVEAREDDYGWFVKSEFHSTQTAQDARTIAAERKAAGKQVGFSFGYLPVEYEWVDAKDFKDKLPQYVKQDRLEVNLTKAQKFNRIRVLKKVEAPEDSLVLAGMNKLAAATAVKSTNRQELHIFVNAEPGTKFADAVVQSVKDAVLPENTSQDKEDLNDSTDSNLKGESVSGSFESFDDVVAALEKHTLNMQRNHENRVKEGRILSASNRAKVIAARDALDELLVASEPQPKEKAVDMEALRTQSQRRHSAALAALAPQA